MKERMRDNRRGSQSRGSQSGGFDRDGGRFGGNFRGGSRNSSYSSAPREMHKATCAECKMDCEVPFKPTEGRPVYCKECFRKKNDRF